MVKKTINVLLQSDVKYLGNAGEVKKVALGYARNYLIPAQLVCKATNQILAKVQKDNEEKKYQLMLLRQEKIKLKSSIEQLGKITIRKKIGQNNAIFGSVTEKELLELIENNLGEKIEKRCLTIPDIKEIGVYDIEIKLYSDITTKLAIQVIPEE
uniref:ribosomal protein L9 n=1 Tax=Erythrolobus coxiae TaxID=362235 RepID=UPI001FCD1C5A|nr:ribosomal protein L9 [Erythrolobus coxiae]UNJ17716.1 ribosomal protein L9 [Erythrolobus coxiae]